MTLSWYLFQTHLPTNTNFEKFISTFSQLMFLWTCFFVTSQDFAVWTLLRSCPEMFCKKGVLRNFAKCTGKHLCQSFFFNKTAGLQPATSLKKKLWHRCFPVNFAKFLKTPTLTEHLWWLLLFVSANIYRSFRKITKTIRQIHFVIKNQFLRSLILGHPKIKKSVELRNNNKNANNLPC